MTSRNRKDLLNLADNLINHFNKFQYAFMCHCMRADGNSNSREFYAIPEVGIFRPTNHAFVWYSSRIDNWRDCILKDAEDCLNARLMFIAMVTTLPEDMYPTDIYPNKGALCESNDVSPNTPNVQSAINTDD